LKHYQIHKPLVSYHEHNEAMRTAQLVERLAAGENIALITDAGTPVFLIGARLIRECIKRELPFTIIPALFNCDGTCRLRILGREIFRRRISAGQKRPTRAASSAPRPRARKLPFTSNRLTD